MGDLLKFEGKQRKASSDTNLPADPQGEAEIIDLTAHQRTTSDTAEMLHREAQAMVIEVQILLVRTDLSRRIQWEDLGRTPEETGSEPVFLSKEELKNLADAKYGEKINPLLAKVDLMSLLKSWADQMERPQ